MSLLFLLPPSCMVAPIGNIANKLFFPSTFSSSTTFNSQTFVLPTVFPSNYMGMDISAGPIPVNGSEVRGKTSSIEKNYSRDMSTSSTQLSVIYHERMANNGMNIDPEPANNFPALSYEMKQEKALHFSKATETLGNTRPQNGNNEATYSNPEHGFNVNQSERLPYDAAPHGDDNNVINIQLPYDPNAPTKPDLWSSSFHPISLYGSIKQIASDTKSIKDSLNFIARYITNKKVNSSKANDLLDFDGIGDSIWNFISSVYQANWDSLYTDNRTSILRAKISSKFSPSIAPTTNKNNKKTNKLVLVTINKVPLPPPLPAKSKREVNVISKYFQNNKPLVEAKKLTETKKPAMLYAQAIKPSANTSEVLKIKEAFLALNAKKIDQINNIVKGNPKLKP